MRPYNFVNFLLVVHMVYLVNGENKYNVVVPIKEEYISFKSAKMQLNYVKMRSACMPRMVLVKLQPPSGHTYYPNLVELKRCDGVCYNDVSCMATATNITSVVVMGARHDENVLRYKRIYLEEHTACKCLCNVMKRDCNGNQKYIKDDCECRCMNIKDKESCSKMPERRWSSEHCKCMCNIKEEECSTGLSWVPDHCSCMSVNKTGINVNDIKRKTTISVNFN